MTEKASDIEKYKTKNSSRHHYIPQFLIERFTNSEKVVYVYDKNRNKILNKPKAPKAIFFERDRNTINLPDDKQSSILEDLLYLNIDKSCSKIVKYFQDTELNKIDYNSVNIAQFLFFLVSLFWRIPLTDFAVTDLVENANIESKGVGSDLLKSNSDLGKIQRGGIIAHAISEIIGSSTSESRYVNIQQMSNEILVLGDNPLLFRKTSTKFSEFGKDEFLIALTSRRIYSSTFGPLTNINALNYNAAIINQSLRYVCSSNLDCLEKSVKIYKEFCKHGLDFSWTENTFKSENNIV
jgi:hypothetical protein